MKTEWDLDVNVVTFVLSNQSIDRQQDEYPVILDLAQDGGVVEIEVVLPVPLDILQRILDSIDIDKANADSIVNTICYGNMRALMFGTATIPQSPYVADPNELTVTDFQAA